MPVSGQVYGMMCEVTFNQGWHALSLQCNRLKNGQDYYAIKTKVKKKNNNNNPMPDFKFFVI